MNRKALIIIAGSILSITLVSGIVIATVSGKSTKASGIETSASDYVDSDESDYTYISPPLEDTRDEDGEDAEDAQPEIDEEVINFTPADTMDLDPTSITVFVNKEHALPKDYKPKNLVTPNIRFDITYYDERTLLRPEASKALEKLFSVADEDGYELIGVSGYRSYNRQYKIFTNNIATKGKTHTLMYSAVPGTSEHQTGLAIDVSSESLHNKLSEGFAETPEGKWLADHAYKYGFIIRYPKDKAEITGYAYEPWHIRYVGKGLAYYLYTNKLTLDEYYNYTPSPGFDFEALYADIINYAPPTMAPSSVPSTSPTVTPTKGADAITGIDDPKGPTPTKAPDIKDPEEDISATPVPTPTSPPEETNPLTGIPQEDGTNEDGTNSGKDNSSDTENPEGTAITTDILVE